jgi:hypothetical protein
MKATVDFKFFLIGLTMVGTAILTATGHIQQVIHFSSVDNEIGFFLLLAGAGAMCIFSSFTKSN